MAKKTESTKTTALTTTNVEKSDVWSNMNEALKDATLKVNEKIDSMASGMIYRLWQIGAFLHNVRNNENKYGPQPIQAMGEALGTSKKTYLTKSLKLHEWLPDEEKFKKMLGLRTKSSKQPLSWGHFETLLTVQDTSERDKLLTKAAENDWTPEELQHEVSQKPGHKSNKNAGRKVKVQPSYRARLLDAISDGAALSKKADNIWLDATNGITAVAKEVDLKKKPEEFVTLFESIEEQYRIVSEYADQIVAASKNAAEILSERVKTAEEESEEDDDAPDEVLEELEEELAIDE